MDSISQTKENTISTDVSQFSYWKKTHSEKELDQCPEFQPCGDIVATAMHPQSRTMCDNSHVRRRKQNYISLSIKHFERKNLNIWWYTLDKNKKTNPCYPDNRFQEYQKVETEILQHARRYSCGSYSKTQCSRDFKFCVKKRACECHLWVWRN